MPIVQSRKFNFFDKVEVVKDASGEDFIGLQNIDITSYTSGRGHMLFGDSDGFIHLLDRSWEVSSFSAYDASATHLLQLKRRSILLSIGSDLEGINPTLKVWNTEYMSHGVPPICTCTMKIVHNGKPIPVSVLAADEELSCLAIGLVNGVVILIRGDLSRDRFSRQKIIYEDANRLPVTGLGFRGNSLSLFITTSRSTVFVPDVNGDAIIVQDTDGGALGCVVMRSAEQDLVVGRPDAVFLFDENGRGPCVAFEGSMEMLYWYRNYLVIVERSKKGAAHNRISDKLERLHQVTVYDLNNKFFAYNGTFSDVVGLLSEWGLLFVMTADRRLHQLEEKDIETRLEALFKKSLFPLAISLAKGLQYNYDGIIDIFTKYGDHLYSKGDYDNAVAQYVRTIGKLEPSYVIKRFLDAQRIHNLTFYLQKLHGQGYANEDHTTLLLNCYTKLKDVTRLDEFIKTPQRELNFDVDTAIVVLRQAGYHEHALYLATQYHQHDWHLKIMLEDVKRYYDALKYIETLPFYDAEMHLKKYGKELVSDLPEKTTNLLISLCTGYKPKTEESEVSQARSQPEEFIHIFVNHIQWLTIFLERIVQMLPNSSHVVYNTLLELYLRTDVVSDDGVADSSLDDRRLKALELLKNPEAHYDLDHAMVLAQMHDFRPGIMHLYEKAKLFPQIIQYHMDHDNYRLVLSSCKKYAHQDPGLWLQALSYFASKEEGCRQQIMEVLNNIEHHNLLQPLRVIQILSKNPSATLSLVKNYITTHLQMNNKFIHEDEAMITHYRNETSRMRSEMEELRVGARVIQVTKCCSCNSLLDLPAVHFLCKHSYHHRCLGDEENKCPICQPEHKKISEMICAQEQRIGEHEQFFKQLEGNDDGFSVVADYFGRGIFNKVTLVTDPPVMKTRGGSIIF